MRFINISKIAVVLFLAFFSSNSFAQLYFEIAGDEDSKTNIQFSGFQSQDPTLDRDLKIISDKIIANLNTTNLFKIINSDSEVKFLTPSSYLDQNSSFSVEEYSAPISSQGTSGYLAPSVNPIFSIESVPDFERYSSQNISAILIAQANYDLEGNIELRLRVWDVVDRKQLFGKFYSSSFDNYQKLSNTISNEIFKSLTGELAGHFNSKILYISESGKLRKRVKRLAIMDFDGNNKSFLTNGRNLVLTPIFSKNPYEVFYLSYKDDFPQIFKLDLMSQTSIPVGGFRGTTYAAAAHPKDSNKVLLSAIFDGNSDIYEMDIAQNTATRLTKNPAIDTTASYSPDGEDIVFVSDRTGERKIYIMDRNGSSIRLLSKGAGNYSKPVFSPSGNMIAFTVLRNSKFYIAIMTRDGEDERLLTSAYLAEGAKFSPNGRYLVYSKTRSAYGPLSVPKLFIIDTISGYEYQLPSEPGEGASDPDWGEI